MQILTPEALQASTAQAGRICQLHTISFAIDKSGVYGLMAKKMVWKKERHQTSQLKLGTSFV